MSVRPHTNPVVALVLWPAISVALASSHGPLATRALAAMWVALWACVAAVVITQRRPLREVAAGPGVEVASVTLLAVSMVIWFWPHWPAWVAIALAVGFAIYDGIEAIRRTKEARNVK